MLYVGEATPCYITEISQFLDLLYMFMQLTLLILSTKVIISVI